MESTDLDMGDIFDENDDEDIGATGVLPDLPDATQTQEDGEEENAEVLARLKNLSKGAAKKVVRRPQPKLDGSRLTGERGIPILPKLFENVKFKGKGHEAHDLALIMRQMEHWSHRLFPKMPFDEVIERVEKLGSKGDVKTCVKKMRMDMPILDNEFVGPERDDDDDDDDIIRRGEEQEERADVRAEDMWDELLREEAELTGSQPPDEPSTSNAAPGSQRKPDQRQTEIPSTPLQKADNSIGGFTPEMLERIERNKQLAMEKRMKKMGQMTPGSQSASIQNTSSSSGTTPAKPNLNSSRTAEQVNEQERSQSEEESHREITNSDDDMSEVLDKGPSQNIAIVDKFAQNAQNWNSEPLDQSETGLSLGTDGSKDSELEKVGDNKVDTGDDKMDMETGDGFEGSIKEKNNTRRNDRESDEGAKDNMEEKDNDLTETLSSNPEEMSEIIEKQEFIATKVTPKETEKVTIENSGIHNELSDDQEMSEVIEKQDAVTVVLKEKSENVSDENGRHGENDISKNDQEVDLKAERREVKENMSEKTDELEKDLDKENVKAVTGEKKIINGMIDKTGDHGVEIHMEDFDDELDEELTEDQLMDTLDS